MIDIDVQKIAKMYSMQGVPLISIIGGERNGFYQQDAIKLVRFFLTEVIPIVGVDVYLLKKGILYLTEARDNWYCERLKNECLFLYTQRSCTSAIIIRKTIFSAILKRNDQNSKPKRKTKWSWKHQTLNTKSSIEKPRKICIFRGFFVCKNLLNSRKFRTFASVKLMLCVLIH